MKDVRQDAKGLADFLMGIELAHMIDEHDKRVRRHNRQLAKQDTILMALNKNLNRAKRDKKDEFYTQLSDIENELRHYKDHFKGKVVYCNCDDPRVSNFFHYFSYNFEHLGLKKLVTTCYKNQNPDLFSSHDTERAIMLEYDGFRDGERVPRVEDIGIKELNGDGDFRSQECIDILKQADIVVTNPPFSLFRDFVAQLIEHGKKFLIVGNHNAIDYRDFFPHIKDNKVWLGITPQGRDMLFKVPEEYAKELAESKKEGSAYRIVEGKIMGRLGNAAWFTNLDHAQRHAPLVLYRKYTPDDYPMYDNYDAIEVGNIKDIPIDYEGVMGVPITFIEKYNPDQFEIVGKDFDAQAGFLSYLVNSSWKGKVDRGYVNGKRKYSRVFIRNRIPEK